MMMYVYSNSSVVMILLILLLELLLVLCNNITIIDNQVIDIYSLTTSMLLLYNEDQTYWSLTLYGNDYEGLQTILSSLSYSDQIDIICNETKLDNELCNKLRIHIMNEVNKRQELSLLSSTSSSSRLLLVENDCYYASYYSSKPHLRYYNIINTNGLLEPVQVPSYTLPTTTTTNDMIGVDAIYVMHWDHNTNRTYKIKHIKEWLGTYRIGSLWVTDFDGEALECKVSSLSSSSSSSLSLL